MQASEFLPLLYYIVVFFGRTLPLCLKWLNINHNKVLVMQRINIQLKYFIPLHITQHVTVNRFISNIIKTTKTWSIFFNNKRIVTRYNSADSVPPSIDGAQRIHPMFADTEILEFSILTFFRLKHDLMTTLYI